MKSGVSPGAHLCDQFGSNEAFTNKQFIQGPEGRWEISNNGGIAPKWKQQNELIYIEGEKVMRVPLQTTPSFSAATPDLLFEGPYIQMDVTSDHQRFVNYTKGKRDAGLS